MPLRSISSRRPRMSPICSAPICLPMIFLFLSCVSSEPETEKGTGSQSSSNPQKPIHSPPHGGHHPQGAHHNGSHPQRGHSPQGGPSLGQQKSFSVEPTYSWTGTASKEPKSIVLISLDTVRADRLSVYGGRAKTPKIAKKLKKKRKHLENLLLNPP